MGIRKHLFFISLMFIEKHSEKFKLSTMYEPTIEESRGLK
jgi:hypothetical protein